MPSFKTASRYVLCTLFILSRHFQRTAVLLAKGTYFSLAPPQAPNHCFQYIKKPVLNQSVFLLFNNVGYCGQSHVEMNKKKLHQNT